MINLYETRNDLLSISEHLDECVLELLNQVDYDVIKLIEFNDEKNCAVCRRSFFRDKNGEMEQGEEKIRFFKNQEMCILKLLINKKQVVLFSNDLEEKQYKPLVEGAIDEIYLPMFLDNTENKCIIGCVYIGTFKENSKVGINDIFIWKTFSTIMKIQNLCQIIYLKEYTFSLLVNGVNVLSQVAEKKEPFMVEHPYRVAQWAKTLAEKLRLDAERVERIYLAGIAHDVGKLYIDNEILIKKGRLTNEEYEEVKHHAVYGFNMLRDVLGFEYNLKDVPNFVKYHHERYDGKGYPEGLMGDEIPLESRILAVADSVDVMMSYREYTKPKNLNDIVEDLIKNSGKQFDPDVAKIMIDLLLKTKENADKQIRDVINWGTISITTDDDTYNMEGNLAQFREGYVFTTDKFDFSRNIDFCKVEDISLYLSSHNNILQYDVKLNYFSKTRLYISKLTAKPLPEAFSILWSLYGFIDAEEYKKNINIYKIGGSSLCFYTIKKGIDNLIKDKVINIEVYFGSDEGVIVTGKIIGSFRVGNQYHYNFKYVCTDEIIKDKIFSKIFKKQIEMKKLVNESLNN